MKRSLTINDGYKLIKLARRAIETHLNKKEYSIDEDIINRYSEKSGVFVTLLRKSSKEELRGCIGYPLPYKPLYSAIIDSAISATRDPRFEPVNIDELNNIIIELSILTTPELLNGDRRDYPKHIKIGRDGLLIHWRYGSGLLLPQVAIEYNFDPEQFLCETCIKANAYPDCWLYEDTKVYKFQAIIFKELEPNGDVILLNKE